MRTASKKWRCEFRVTGGRYLIMFVNAKTMLDAVVVVVKTHPDADFERVSAEDEPTKKP